MDGEGPALGSIVGTGHFGLGWALPRLDESVSALLEDLDDRGLLDTTLGVLVREFGRSPQVSNAGRDHWPACYSALLAGAGGRGGMVHGASDRTGAYVADNPVSLEDFGATLFHAPGVPPETRLGADGFMLVPPSHGEIGEVHLVIGGVGQHEFVGRRVVDEGVLIDIAALVGAPDEVEIRVDRAVEDDFDGVVGPTVVMDEVRRNGVVRQSRVP